GICSRRPWFKIAGSKQQFDGLCWGKKERVLLAMWQYLKIDQWMGNLPDNNPGTIGSEKKSGGKTG
ncbi:4297_t:CDS:1, partial [Racocetra persica]